MSTRTIIGANHPKHCAPGGFTKRKRRTRDLYREAKSIRDCAIKFLERRGIHSVPDAFTAQQKVMSAERHSKHSP